LRNNNYGKTISGFYPTGTVYGYRVTGNWSETGLAWNSKPSYDPAIVAESPFNNVNDGWIEFDITSLYNDWKSGTPNYGIMLNTDGSDAAGTCTGNNEWNCRPGSFYSSDYENASYRPKLVIQP